MSERNIFEGIGETVELEIENTDALKELFNKTKEESLKIKKRFADGTYTEDDLLNHLPRFGLGTKDKIEMYVVESKYFEDLANRYTNLKEIEKSHKEENGKLREEIIRLDNVLKAKKQEIAYLKIQIPSDRIFYFSDKDYISKDKIKELLENETIDISGFRCIAVEDIENLLEGK